MTEPDMQVVYRPNAKRPWLIKRGHEKVRLTHPQMNLVRGCLRSNPSQPESWTQGEDGTHVHTLRPSEPRKK